MRAMKPGGGARVVVALCLLLSACSGGPQERQPETTGQRDTKSTMLFAGDVHFAGRTERLLKRPEAAFGQVSKEFQEADVSLINMETAVTTRGDQQQKAFTFRTSPKAYDAVQAAGVDAVSVANNHTLDYGDVGLADTLKHARAKGIEAFGAGPDAGAAWRPWTKTVKGTKVAVVGISQVHELAEQWRATGSRPGVAHSRDVRRSVRAIKAAGRDADVVIAFLHWGQEGDECPTAEQKGFARKLSRAGADAIVGTHAHLLQGAGWLGDTYVHYGLGNFLWWRNDAMSNDTGMLRLTLDDKRLAGTEFVPAQIDRKTGQPEVATGKEGKRIRGKVADLRKCAGLSAKPR